LNRVKDREWFKDRQYIGYGRCSYKLLYRVFGIDVIAYLFNKHWIPEVTIEDFIPYRFLERLSVLERAAEKMNQDMTIPLRLSGDATRFALGKDGPGESWFEEDKDGFFLDHSLNGLRKFGRLTRLAHNAGIPFTVKINFYSAGWPLSAAVMQYATPVGNWGDKNRNNRGQFDPPLDFRWWLRGEDTDVNHDRSISENQNPPTVRRKHGRRAITSLVLDDVECR
jgi:hypothetical protein